MGEYAKRRSDGAEIKIGTCEDMYYLRADQRNKVTGIPGSSDPNGDDAFRLRFRFPWPDEDGTEPGTFERYHRSYGVPGYREGLAHAEHGTVQFTAQAGYNLSIPCPEGPRATDPAGTGFIVTVAGLTVHRNGFGGAVHLVQQKLLADGRLVPVLMCGGCGAKWRLENPDEIMALVVAIRADADHREREGRFNGTGKADRRWFDAVADRILDGAGLALVCA